MASPPRSMESRKLSELLADAGDQAKVLISKEVELAKVEMRQEASRASKAGALLGATGFAAALAALLLSLAAAFALAAVMPAGLAFLVVGLVYLGVAAVLLRKGRQQLRAVNWVPQRALRGLADDGQAAKAALSRGATAGTGPASPGWG